uniref:FBD domain-containing protein n=1 Tax=Oryza meridionalis TaxID=40149 RepID=A0A0E0CTD6_9ORYZ
MDAIRIHMNAAVSDATDNILNFRNQEIPLRQLSITFYLKYYDCLTIGKAVARARATHSHKLDSAEFIILPEKKLQYCTIDDRRRNGKQLMTFFDACTDAFAGLTRLHLRNLKLAETDIPNIIATCKRLEYLRLSMCQTEDSVLQLQVEHPRLVELDISSAGLELVELPTEPQTIWVQPECPKLLSPVLQNLQVLNLDELPEGRDIAWTCFFLEAAPSLKEMCITVWDHWHYNLTKLTIYGFQPNENFMGYIRHVMEAAVNLEDISLYDRKVLECCEVLDPKIEVAPSRYPQTIEEQELLRKQIIEGLVMASPHIIHFRS